MQIMFHSTLVVEVEKLFWRYFLRETRDWEPGQGDGLAAFIPQGSICTVWCPF